MPKMIHCKTCGEEIAANAKACPKCGAKNPKPIWKRWWFWAIIAVILISIIASSGNKSEGGAESSSPSSEQSEPIEYTHYNVTELFDDLKGNAMKAEQLHENEYVEIEGYLGTIDSDGKYIGVGASSGGLEYFLQSVQCFLKNDEQRAQIMELSKGDPITVRGKITDVGEILGYQLKIDSIN